ncbi:YmfQ family protein [Paraburkholderia nodosa]|uniref:YmfQ family protein n=1 Tax=Paraburkholderia nodosa TaxID=392320 RepID=UPI000841837B|nr:putative phage tail protein [Paraburkholderia nodosa]
MLAPNYSAADYLRALQALLPRGRVWPRDTDAKQSAVLGTLTPVFERLNARANNLLIDAFPASTYELLPEWELTLGLPDPCAGEQPTVAARRAQVLARFAGTGGQSIQYFIDYAARLGFTVTVTQYAPFRMGQQAMGSQLGSPDWAFTWAVNAPLASLIPFTMGQSAMGDALQSWNNTVLECELNTVKPAHTLLLFTYGLGRLNENFVLNENTLG